MSFALNFSVFLSVSIFCVFGLYFLNLFCNNRFLLFISNTLVVITGMDYGLFSSWSNAINKHYFSDEYARIRKQIRKVAHSVRTRYPNNGVPCIPKEEDKNAFRPERNAGHRRKPYGGLEKQPPVSFSQKISEAVALHEIEACYLKEYVSITPPQSKSESLKRVSAWLDNQPHSFMKRRTEVVVLHGIEAYYQNENSSTSVLQSKSASLKKTSVKQPCDSLAKKETKDILHEIEAYNHNVRVLSLRKSVKKVSADTEERPRANFQEKETEAVAINGVEAYYRRDNEPNAIPRCKYGNPKKISAGIEKQYRLNFLQIKTEASAAQEIEAYSRRDNVSEPLPLAKSDTVEKVSASLEKRPRVSCLQKEGEAIDLHGRSKLGSVRNVPTGALEKETEAVVLNEIQPCNNPEENFSRTRPRVKSATINKASAVLEQQPRISFLEENSQAAAQHKNEAYNNRESVPTTSPRVKSRTVKKVVIDESKNIIRRIETEKRSPNLVGYRQERNKYANLSCEELNCRVEEFIQRFNMQIRVQGQAYAVAR